MNGHIPFDTIAGGNVKGPRRPGQLEVVAERTTVDLDDAATGDREVATVPVLLQDCLGHESPGAERLVARAGLLRCRDVGDDRNGHRRRGRRGCYRYHRSRGCWRRSGGSRWGPADAAGERVGDRSPLGPYLQGRVLARRDRRRAGLVDRDPAAAPLRPDLRGLGEEDDHGGPAAVEVALQHRAVGVDDLDVAADRDVRLHRLDGLARREVAVRREGQGDREGGDDRQGVRAELDEPLHLSVAPVVRPSRGPQFQNRLLAVGRWIPP